MVVTFNDARRSLAQLIERVNADCVQIEIMSEHGSAVLMSKSEYDALVETAYLLRSPENAHRLMAALRSTRDIENAAE